MIVTPYLGGAVLPVAKRNPKAYHQERHFTREKLKTMLTNADARLAEYLADLVKADAQDGSPPAGTPPTRNLTEKIATLQQAMHLAEGSCEMLVEIAGLAVQPRHDDLAVGGHPHPRRQSAQIG